MLARTLVMQMERMLVGRMQHRGRYHDDLTLVRVLGLDCLYAGMGRTLEHQLVGRK